MIRKSIEHGHLHILVLLPTNHKFPKIKKNTNIKVSKIKKKKHKTFRIKKYQNTNQQFSPQNYLILSF